MCKFVQALAVQHCFVTRPMQVRVTAHKLQQFTYSATAGSA